MFSVFEQCFSSLQTLTVVCIDIMCDMSIILEFEGNKTIVDFQPDLWLRHDLGV